MEANKPLSDKVAALPIAPLGQEGDIQNERGGQLMKYIITRCAEPLFPFCSRIKTYVFTKKKLPNHTRPRVIRM